MSELQGKFIWYDLLTPDTAGAADFYGKVLGWTTEPMDGMDYTVFNVSGEMQGTGGMMPLSDEMKAMGMPPNWTGYVYVDDVDAAAQRFVELGGAINRPPADIPGIGRFAVVADPQGAVLCIFKPLPRENPPAELDHRTPGLCGWRELYALDGATAFDFYAKVFGWTKDQAMDMGPMGTYQTFAQNGAMIGGMMTKTPEVPMACWGYYFIVDDIDRGAEQVQAAGGKVLNGPMAVPDGYVANCSDPQGAYFSIMGSRH